MSEHDALLQKLYQLQQDYNRIIRRESGNASPEFWTQTYLLGLMTEMDEVLREINWKRHRRETHNKVDMVNLGYELSDLLKYVLSLWEVWGFSAQEMLEYSLTKTEMLEVQYQQDHTPIPTNRPILVTDLDGTIADYRAGFLQWLAKRNQNINFPDQVHSLMMDQDLAINYPEYNALKEAFESEGGYRNLPCYPDGISALHHLRDKLNVYIIAITARPADRFHRIWLDSWLWIRDNGLPIDQLRIGSDPRILLAHELAKDGSCVLFDDDPGIIRRASSSGLSVYVRRQIYNQGLENLPHVKMVDSYMELDLDNLFIKEKTHA